MSAAKPPILHVAQPTTAGVSHVVQQLVRAGIHDGRQVTVACPDDGDLHLAVQREGASWIHIAMRRSPHPSDAKAFLKLVHLMGRDQIVMAHSSKAGVLVRIAALVTRSRVVFMPHGWSWFAGGKLKPLYKFIERALSRGSATTVVVSPSEREQGLLVLGRAADLRLIENAVQVDAYKAKTTNDAGPILCVGRLTEQKGQDLLIRSLALLRDGGTQLRLLGPGDPTDLAALAESLGVRHRVQFIGPGNPASHYTECQVLVLPSRWEGLPLVLLEGMASGCPIVASSRAVGGSIGAHECLIVDFDVAETTFVERLADALDEMVLDRTKRESYSRASRRAAATRFDISQLEDSYSRLWSELDLERNRTAIPLGEN